MLVFVGETGDTDYEGLLSGAHKTVILKGSVKSGSENLLRSFGSYQREDVVPEECPRTAYTEKTYTSEEIVKALSQIE